MDSPLVEQLKKTWRFLSHKMGWALLQARYLDRREVYGLLDSAMQSKVGFAIGKVGSTEMEALYHYHLHGNTSKLAKLMYTNSGIFPNDHGVLARWLDLYLQNVCQLDVIVPTSANMRVVRLASKYWSHKKLAPYHVTQPSGSDAELNETKAQCYTPLLRGKKVLIVNPIASFLKERATEQVFKKCWGERADWWHPESVLAWDIPNAVDESVRKEFSDALELLEFLRADLRQRNFDFDVALIGAAAYAVPLAVEIKKMGKVAIIPGGHLQMMFGVYGARWEKMPKWQQVINEFWTKPPEQLRPSHFQDQENGCYW